MKKVRFAQHPSTQPPLLVGQSQALPPVVEHVPLSIYGAQKPPPLTLRERLRKNWPYGVMFLLALGVIGYGLFTARKKMYGEEEDEEEVAGAVVAERQGAATQKPLKSILKKKSRGNAGRKLNKQEEIERMQAETEKAKQEIIEQARRKRVHEIETSITQLQTDIEGAAKMIRENQELFKHRFADKSSEAVSFDTDQSSFEQDNGFDSSFMLKAQLDTEKKRQGELHKRLVEEQQDAKKQILNNIQELRHLEPGHSIIQMIDSVSTNQEK
jgi:hypothetical protein